MNPWVPETKRECLLGEGEGAVVLAGGGSDHCGDTGTWAFRTYARAGDRARTATPMSQDSQSESAYRKRLGDFLFGDGAEKLVITQALGGKREKSLLRKLNHKLVSCDVEQESYAKNMRKTNPKPLKPTGANRSNEAQNHCVETCTTQDPQAPMEDTSCPEDELVQTFSPQHTFKKKMENGNESRLRQNQDL